MTTILQFDHIRPPRMGNAGVVGDTVGALTGAPSPALQAEIAVNVTRQPAGSDVFSGLGTDGADLPYSDLASATIAVAGRYDMAIAAAAGFAPTERFSLFIWPSEALEVAALKYRVRTPPSTNVAGLSQYPELSAEYLTRNTRTNEERRKLLREMAFRCNPVTFATHIESLSGDSRHGIYAEGIGLPGRLEDYGLARGW